MPRHKQNSPGFLRVSNRKLLDPAPTVIVPTLALPMSNESDLGGGSNNAFALPFGVLGAKKKRGRGRPPVISQKGNHNVTVQGTVNSIKEIGLPACPQCRLEFDGVTCSPIQEACGHVKCRACFIQSLAKGDNYCQQCQPPMTMDNGRKREKNEKTERAKIPAQSPGNHNTMEITPIRVNLANASNNDENKTKTKTTLTKSSSLTQAPSQLLISSTKNNENRDSQSSQLILNRVQSTKQIPSRETINMFHCPPEAPFDSQVTITKPKTQLHDRIQTQNNEGNKVIPKVTLQIESKDDEGNVSRAKVKGVKRKTKQRRRPIDIPEYIDIIADDPPRYKCLRCDKQFKTKAHIKYHYFCTTDETDKPYKCDQCGRGFVAKSHYEYHLRIHSGERPYQCKVCLKGFNQRGKVTRHMRSHSGEKPFICQQCGRGFANAQALRSHFLIHTGERPFACQYCAKRFTGMTNLKKHVITHTGERPFECTHCGKTFGLKWTLDLHMRTHSTDRPFACDQCTRAFSNSKDLRRHLVIHSGERPFKCEICGSAFRRKDNCDRHLKHVHGVHCNARLPTSFQFKNPVVPFSEADPLAYKSSSEESVDVESPTQTENHIKSKVTQTNKEAPPANVQELLPLGQNENEKCTNSSAKEHSDDSVTDEIISNNPPKKSKGLPGMEDLDDYVEFSRMIKQEVKDAETIVEDLVRAGFLSSGSEGETVDRTSPISINGDVEEEEDPLIQDIFIKQEHHPHHHHHEKPVVMKIETNLEMESEMMTESMTFRHSQGVTVVHDENGATHIVL